MSIGPKYQPTTLVDRICTAGLVMLATLLAAVMPLGCSRKPDPSRPSNAQVAPTEKASRDYGVHLSVTSGSIEIERTLPFASFELEAGQTLDWRLSPGPFEAVITVTFDPGSVREAYLGAEIRGGGVIMYRQEMMIRSSYAGAESKLVMTHQPITLTLRREQVRYVLTPDDSGSVHFRAMWRPMETPVAHPLPSVGAPMLDGDVRQGMKLARDLNCAACHRSTDAALQARLSRAQAPILDEGPQHIQVDWMIKWLTDPKSVDPGARMPNLLQYLPDREQALEELVAYLYRTPGYVPVIALGYYDETVRKEGRLLYHTVGCVPCHGPLETASELFGEADPPGQPARFYRALDQISAKMSTGALAKYLRDPWSMHPDGRMPSMALSEKEARAIALYLNVEFNLFAIAMSSHEIPEVERIEQGRERFLTLGCVNCHQTDELADETRVSPPTLESLNSNGCLAEHPAAGLPDFDLTETQRNHLRAFLRSLPDLHVTSSPIDDLLFAIDKFNCTACHSFHGESGPEPAIKPYFRHDSDADLGDEGRLPPDLTDAGARFTTTWMEQVLRDGARARPYMQTRMPQYGEANVASLQKLFAAAGGAMQLVDEDQTPDAMQLEAGRMLVGGEGFNCIQCHALAERPATEFPGPDLAAMPDRLRYDWFLRRVIDPHWINPETRMTRSFFGGRSIITEHYAGRADDQIGAMWMYLRSVDSQSAPSEAGDP